LADWYYASRGSKIFLKKTLAISFFRINLSSQLPKKLPTDSSITT
jgi:hypothetical protein